jgi:hypothetical protein
MVLYLFMVGIKKFSSVFYLVEVAGNFRDYVLKVCEEEWDPEDFDLHGKDLYESEWVLREVKVGEICPNKELLRSDEFQADVTPRTLKQEELHRKSVPIPPLILREKDLLIFDGYARYLFFNRVGIDKCLAYVGKR